MENVCGNKVSVGAVFELSISVKFMVAISEENESERIKIFPLFSFLFKKESRKILGKS